MAVTRDQARRLLTEPEMALFGDSRNPALRALSARELERRIERTRKLRDKSRDLFQRQQLKARTGDKRSASGLANERTARKAEVLDDILQRFGGRLQEVQRTDGATARANAVVRTSGRNAAGKTTARKAAAAQAPKARTRAAGAGKAARTPVARSAKQGTRARSTATDGSAQKASGAAVAAKAKRPRASAITPDRALANTRQLLESKQQQDRERPPYRRLDAQAAGFDQAQPDFQSEAARARANELHAGEARLDSIHGSVSRHDRLNQGKRDHR